MIGVTLISEGFGSVARRRRSHASQIRNVSRSS